MLVFDIPGQPRPWKRANIVKKGKYVTKQDPADQRDRKQSILLLAINEANNSGFTVVDSDYLSISMHCYFKGLRMADCDNLLKLVLDSIQPGIVPDDRQFCSASVYCYDDSETPHTRVMISKVGKRRDAKCSNSTAG